MRINKEYLKMGIKTPCPIMNSSKVLPPDTYLQLHPIARWVPVGMMMYTEHLKSTTPL